MKLPNIRQLKAEADYAYRRARDPKKLILAFAGISILVATVLTLISGWLNNQIADTGGLSNFGLRSILSTAQNVLPIAQTVILWGLEFGYLHGTLRMARGQYADHTDLKTGFRRLFPVLRLNILMGFRFLALGMVSFYTAILVFLYTPWSDPLVELLMPILETAKTSADIVSRMDTVTLDLAAKALTPMLVIFGVLYALLAIPMYYKLRLSAYVLLDDPKGQAFLAMRQSTLMMNGNRRQMLKLDLHFWWYYLLSTLATAVANGDVLLPMLGITLPFSDTMTYYLFYFLYLAMLFAIYYFFRNRMAITYAKAYDALVEKPRDDGVVLGSIFDV